MMEMRNWWRLSATMGHMLEDPERSICVLVSYSRSVRSLLSIRGHKFRHFHSGIQIAANTGSIENGYAIWRHEFYTTGKRPHVSLDRKSTRLNSSHLGIS